MQQLHTGKRSPLFAPAPEKTFHQHILKSGARAPSSHSARALSLGPDLNSIIHLLLAARSPYTRRFREVGHLRECLESLFIRAFFRVPGPPFRTLLWTRANGIGGRKMISFVFWHQGRRRTWVCKTLLSLFLRESYGMMAAVHYSSSSFALTTAEAKATAMDTQIWLHQNHFLGGLMRAERGPRREERRWNWEGYTDIPHTYTCKLQRLAASVVASTVPFLLLTTPYVFAHVLTASYC